MFASGDIYTGEWRQGKGHGQGCLKYADGRLYQGQVFNCEENGFGKIVGPGGLEYIGDFKEGEYQGQG